MRTQVLSVHFFRRTARKRERDIQGYLEGTTANLPYGVTLPSWAKGARVEKAGFLQWVVVATENRGH